jgi:hypothetical protein
LKKTGSWLEEADAMCFPKSDAKRWWRVRVKIPLASVLLVSVFLVSPAAAGEPAEFHTLSPRERAAWLEQLREMLDQAKPPSATLPVPNTAAPAPWKPTHDGIRWHISREGFVVLADGTRPMGSRIFARSCFLQFANSFRRWAAAYSKELKVAHLVATAITETGCSEVTGLGSVDNKSTGLMQVTGYTCADLLRVYGGRPLSERACLEKMAKDPDFSVQLAAAYITRPEQLKLTDLDPPKVAAAYNAGGLYFDPRNPWRLRSTGNHIDRFVAAYNAYVSWQDDERAGRRTRSPAVHLTRSAALPKSVDSPAALTALAPKAREGDTIFVGDRKTGRGDFYVFARGQWHASLEDSEH